MFAKRHIWKLLKEIPKFLNFLQKFFCTFVLPEFVKTCYELVIGLLYESEKVGAATGEELHRQKEQLLRTEGRLDEINSTLKQSERHLNGIKSVFGGIKNYLFAKNSGLPPPSTQQAIQATTSSQNQIPHSNSDASIGSSSSRKQFYSQAENDRLDTIRYHSYIT